MKKEKKAIKEASAREEIRRTQEDILSSQRFKKAAHTQHHITTSVADHSLRVAVRARFIATWLQDHGIKVNLEDTVRAALLHDIGMTDDAVHESGSYRKAYLHPRRSASIAKAELGADEEQCDAIKRHMWPIRTFIPPRHREGWIVLAADRYCSVEEFLDRIRKRDKK